MQSVVFPFIPAEHTAVARSRERRTEDMRILAHHALPTEELVRLALRGGLIEDFHVEGGTVQLLMGGAVVELPEHDAHIFLWGLIRGRDLTLAQLGR